MPYEVSRFCPQMLAVALNREHWDKFSWKNRSPSGILSPKPVNCASHREIDGPKDRRGRFSCAPHLEELTLSQNRAASPNSDALLADRLNTDAAQRNQASKQDTSTRWDT